jgi:cytochrome c-type biogenesis protein CcmF
MNVIGYYSILIALFLAGYSSLAAIMGVKGRRGELITSSENAAMAVFAFITLASGAMVYALLTRDFQVEYVWNYTNRSLSWFYTLTAFYAGQKGSLLLWAWLLSIFSVIVVFQNRKKNRELIPYVIGVLMVITFFFTILMVFSTNPFEQFTGRPVDGQGLNPLLQNPGMIFHPPTLYLGYVGFTVPFAFSIAALITGKLGDVWIKTTRRWTIFSWFFLTIGNLFGMEWAYVELGWGGYWAWDPVENASFLPWVMGTAYLHSVMIQEKRGMLKVWNMVLILLTFLLTIFGTFITRSGIIASVHSFGESTLGWIFLIFLFVVLICSLLLLIYRLPHLKSRNQLDSLLSRESTFLYNNLLFVGITFTVFWGTLFPIISEAVRGVKITVGPPFFNSVIIPLGLALLFLTGLCPLVAWRRTTLQKFTKKVLFPSLFSLIGAGVLLLFGIRSFYPLITFTFCIFVFAILVAEFFNGTRARHALSGEGYFLAFYNLVARNKRRYGGYVIHFGIILIFMGFGGNAFNMERQITLNKGESFSIKNYTLRYEALSNYPTTQMDKTVATLTLFNDNHKVGVLSPEKSLYKNQDQPTTEVAIHSTLKEDVYVILAGYEKELATFKVLVNPLVIWIWIGGAIMGIGTVIVMLPNRKRKKDQTS